jgi:hypothetical protein
MKDGGASRTGGVGMLPAIQLMGKSPVRSGQLHFPTRPSVIFYFKSRCGPLEQENE